MFVSYVSDNGGVPVAVQIPIEDWERIKNKYPNIDDLDSELPEWQKQLLDERLAVIKGNPDSVKPIEGLFDELDKDED